MTDTLLAASALAAVVLLGAIVVVLEWRRSVRQRRRERAWEEALQRLRDDMQALCAGAANVGRHLASVDQRLRRLGERQDQVEARDPAQQVYGHAIRLAQRGADVDELIASCGLARGEAELLLRLHSGQAKQH